MGRTVGIDLGTTNSVITVLEAGEPIVIPLADGSRLCPSVVGVSRTGERLIGHLAKRQAITNPDRTIASIKRRMGEFGYHVEIDGKNLTPPEISAMILQKLKADAEAYLGERVSRAVITVPAYFNDAQRQATRDAGQIAGLEVARILNEPTAAALAYGMDKSDVHKVLVWDLGGGTFDVSILEIGDGVLEVQSTNGDSRLGGDDWDERIVDWMAVEFRDRTSVDLRLDNVARQRLVEAAEKAKIELSSVMTTTINLPFIATTDEGPIHLEMDITRSQFESLTTDLRHKMLAPTRQALADAKLTPSDLDVILLAGGSTRMPAVQHMVREMFGKEPFKGTNADEVVALGAAVQAGILDGRVRDLILLDVTPLSLGIETIGGVATKLIARNTMIPTSASRVFTTAADGQSAVDIHVVQGEREFAAANRSLGRFQLKDIPPAPRGLPKIQVTFEIDASGIVKVSARDQASGQEQRVTLTGDFGLSPDQIEDMIVDAARHAGSDLVRRNLQDAKNTADARLYSGESALLHAKEYGDPFLIRTARNIADRLRTALRTEDVVAIRQLTEEFTAAVLSVSAVVALRPADNTTRNYATEDIEFPTASDPVGYIGSGGNRVANEADIYPDAEPPFSADTGEPVATIGG